MKPQESLLLARSIIAKLRPNENKKQIESDISKFKSRKFLKANKITEKTIKKKQGVKYMLQVKFFRSFFFNLKFST